MEKELEYSFGKVDKAARPNACKEDDCWLLMVAFLKKADMVTSPIARMENLL